MIDASATNHRLAAPVSGFEVLHAVLPDCPDALLESLVRLGSRRFEDLSHLAAAVVADQVARHPVSAAPAGLVRV